MLLIVTPRCVFLTVMTIQFRPLIPLMCVMQVHVVTADALTEIAAAINAREPALLRVRDLQPVERVDTAVLKDGETSKTKTCVLLRFLLPLSHAFESLLHR